MYFVQKILFQIVEIKVFKNVFTLCTYTLVNTNKNILKILFFNIYIKYNYKLQKHNFNEN